MAFGSGAWESEGQERDEGTECENGELIAIFATEFVRKLAERHAAGPAWVRM